MLINEIIRKTASGYRLYSKKGKNLGTYDSRAGAEKREKQVNYFKHMSEETGAEMLSIFQKMHHDAGNNDEMDAFIQSHNWELRDFTPVTATTEGVAREPHAAGLAKTALTAPANTVVINTPGELDWYKLGEYIATLQDLDPHEYGQSESDMMVTLANREQVEKLKALLDRFGADYKEIGSTHQHPEVHTETKRRP